MPDISFGLLPGSARRGSLDRDVLLRRLRATAFACGAGVIVLGGAVLAAWGFGGGHFTAIFPALSPMMPNTALMLGFLGTALCLRAPVNPKRAAVVAARGLAVAVLLLSAHSLAARPLDLPGFPFRRLPAPQTAGALLFLSGALFAFERRTSKGGRWAEGLALAAASLGIISGLGHLFRIGLLLGLPGEMPGIGMALPTLAALLALSFGVLIARPEAGITNVIMSAEPGGSAARPMLRGLLYVGPVLALIAYGARQDWFDSSLAAALVAFLGLAWGAASILSTARRLNREAEARRRSEERAREFFDQASDGIFIADVEGRYTDVNDAGCRMLGYPREELIGRTIMDLIRPEDLPRLLQDREDFLRGETRVSEWTLRRKDGTPAEVEVSAKILSDGRWQAFVRDISDRKRAEAALKTAQERLRIFAALVENSSDFIGIADPEGKPVYLNPAGRRMVGLDPDRPLEETRIPEYYAPGQRAFASDVIVKSMVEKGRWKGETFFRHWKTQEAIPVWEEHFLIREPGNGRLLGMGTVTRDLTERKRAEERLELALRGADLAFWDWNIRTGDVVFNSRWAEMRGYRPDEFRPHVESWLSGMHPEDLPRVQKVLHDHFHGKSEYEAEFRVRTKSGGWIWVLDRGRVFARDEKGEPLRMVGTELDITDRKRDEEELRRLGERERFRVALEAAANAMVVVDRDGRVVLVNGEAENLFGWKREELAGKSVDVLVPERFRPAHASHREAFFREDVGRRRMGLARDLSAVRKDGSEIPVEVTLNRVQEGGQVFVIASISDISRRKAAEEEQARLYRRTLDDLNAMTRLQNLGTLSLRGRDLEPLLLEVVDVAIALTGADFGNLQILDPASGRIRIAAQRGFPSWWQEYWDTVSDGRGASGAPLQAGERVIIEDVESSPVLVGTPGLEMQRRAGVRAVQSTPLLSRSGRNVGMLSTHYKTARRPDEAALRHLDLLARQAADLIEQARTEAALRDSEERFRLLVQGTKDYAIFMHDPEGRVNVWNEGAERILGYRDQEILGRNFSVFYPPEEIAQGKHERDLRAAVENGSFQVEAWRMRKDGSRFWASVLITPIVEPGGRILGYGKVLQDLTEKRKAREDLGRTLIELASFTYTVAHDLRSPLRTLQGYPEVLAARLGDRADAESRRMLERMSMAAERLDRLIRDLLAYSMIAREEIRLEDVDLDAIFEHVVAHYPELARVRPRARAPLGRVRAQPSLMIQVLSNLLVNAVKYVPAGRAPEVDVWTEAREGRKKVLVVQDNGMGIPREAWERVFQPFVRLAPTDDGGTGIGLAIVKRAVERMGGRVCLESEPGRGSRFWIELPEA